MIRYREAPELGLLQLSGGDCVSFLQGYVTSDTGLIEEAWQPSAFTSLKGRVTATALLRLSAPDCIDVVVSTDLIEPLQAALAKYLMFARSELTSPATTLFTALGDVPAADRWFDGASLSVGQPPDIGDASLSEPDWHQARLQAGVAWVCAATSDAFLPQMLGLVDRGYVSFDKGCYLGQEVVARAAHRGEVKRRLARLDWQGDQIPTPGQDVCIDGKRIGTVTDSCAYPSNDSGLALAVLSGDLTGNASAPDSSWTASVSAI